MAGTKTGNKGFINPSDGNKVYTMDPVAPGAPGANESPPGYDPGDMTVDNTVRDISQKTRVTLGTYLSDLTRGIIGSTSTPNKYSIDPSTSTSSVLATTTEGHPTPLGISDNSEQFQQILPSNYSQEFATIQQDIKKGKTSGIGVDGNDLLLTATEGLTSTTLVADGPIAKYTAEVSSLNRWEPDGPTFTSGEDPTSPSAAFNVPLQTVALSGLPSERVSTQGSYGLSIDVASTKAAEATVNNEFPVLPSPSANLISTVTNGVPAPPSQSPAGFAPQLPSSFSTDYASSGLTSPDGLQKGKTGVDGPTGHEFIAKVQVSGGEISSPDKLVEYTSEAVKPNRYLPTTDGSGFATSANVSTPPATFDPKLQSVATAVMPNAEAIDPSNAKYELGLKQLSEIPADITEKNDYPITTPNIAVLAATQTYDGFPAPLTPPPNQNSGPEGTFIHAPNLPATPSPDGMKKGKGPGSDPDGHELLGSAFTEGSSGVIPPQPVDNYVVSLTDRNQFDSGSPLLQPEFDVSEPPASYEARIADTNEKGKFESAEKIPITLNRLRTKPAEDTQRNEFPVDKDLDPLVSLVDPATKLPSPLVNTSNNSQFKPREEIKPLSSDASISKLSKGKGSEPYDGHNLLPTIGGNNRISDANDKYSKSYDSQKTVTGTPVKDPTPNDHPIKAYKGDRGNTLSIGNNRFSSSVVDREFNPTYTMKDGTKVTAMKMAQVGYALSQRASSEIPGILGNFDPTGDLAEVGAILPSVSQLGVMKVDDLLLSADDALKSIEGDYPSDKLSEIAYFGNQSWGNLTNVSEPYDDAINIGLVLTAVAMMLVIKGLIFLITLATTNQQFFKSMGGYLAKGRYLIEEPNGIFGASFLPNIYELFGLQPTTFGFEECLDAGLNAYFFGGQTASKTGFFEFLGHILDVITGSGLFRNNGNIYTPLVTCRTIVRSGILLAVGISRVVRSPSITAGVRGALNVFRLIRESKLVRSINVFSTLGNRMLDSRSNVFYATDPSGETLSVDLVQQSKPKIHTSVRKSRLGGDAPGSYDPTLSWSSARAPALYLVSKNAKIVAENDISGELGTFKGLSSLKSEISPGGLPRQLSGTDVPTGNTTGRISREFREKIENALGAEYVPFYFHDVRTNEIISFHAFLASLSDDYTASYDSVEGLGRVEPTKIYKGTTRKIGMSFFVAATNAEDFNHMWYKINKLTTLVYPQYNKGKMLLGKDYNFRAPFSQQVAASPLIRIRLGELLRSNYSRFAMARLFGLTDGDTSVLADNGTENKKPVSINLDAPGYTDEEQKIMNQVAVGDKVTISHESYSAKVSEALRRDIENKGYQETLDFFDTELTTDDSAPGISYYDDNRLLKALTESVTKSKDSWVVEEISTNSSGNRDLKIKFEGKYDGNLRIFEPAQAAFFGVFVSGLVMSIPENYVTIIKTNDSDPKRQEIISKNSKRVEIQSQLNAINQFVQPNNNSITKSFESAGGKGLAGFIESMNFDWYSNTNWEISPGFSAPKFCKVTVSFSPIHDITPGLDHKGYNRAPIYPVGNGLRSAPTKPSKS